MKSEARDSQPTRRYHDRSFKAELVRQSLEPGASVAAIALQNGINANLLFKWRRMHLRANHSATAAPSAVLLPVCVTQTAEPAATSDATVPVAAAAMSRAVEERNNWEWIRVGGV